MSTLPLKTDQTINGMENGKAAAIKKYAIACNHETIALRGKATTIYLMCVVHVSQLYLFIYLFLICC